MNKSSGFTLIELLIVMVIFGVMATTVFISIPKKSADKGLMFSKKFEREFNKILDKSVTEQRQYALEFNKHYIQLLEFKNNEWVKSKQQTELEAFEEEGNAILQEKTTEEKASDIVTIEIDDIKLEAELEAEARKNAWMKIPQKLIITLYVDNQIIPLDIKRYKVVNGKQIKDFIPHVIIASSLESSPFELQLSDSKNIHILKSNTTGKLIYEKN